MISFRSTKQQHYLRNSTKLLQNKYITKITKLDYSEESSKETVKSHVDSVNEAFTGEPVKSLFFCFFIPDL